MPVHVYGNPSDLESVIDYFGPGAYSPYCNEP